MTRRVVVDSSALVAALLDAGPDGRWATGAISGADLAGPSLVGFEVANILRRHELAGLVSPDQAAQAHGDLLDLAVEEFGFEVVAERSWELRRNLTAYDASYVAVAELIGAELVTLDQQISGAPGLRCTVLTPPDSTAVALPL